MLNLKVYFACSSLATWHWGWICASSLFNNGLDSMSHTRLFILNLILANIWYLLATHLHVFFPSMVCVSQEHWPCGHCTCLKVIIFIVFVWLAIEAANHLLHLMNHFHDEELLQQEGFFPFVFVILLYMYFHGWSITFCIDVFITYGFLNCF